MIDQLLTITRGFAHRFPEGNDPYQMMTRLLEESGELAQKVNHFEGSGIKREKYGQPDPQALARENQGCADLRATGGRALRRGS